MKCIKCGSENAENSIYCEKCGEKLEKIRICNNCGNTLSSGAIYCNICGKKYEESEKEVKSENEFISNFKDNSTSQNNVDQKQIKRRRRGTEQFISFCAFCIAELTSDIFTIIVTFCLTNLFVIKSYTLNIFLAFFTTALIVLIGIFVPYLFVKKVQHGMFGIRCHLFLQIVNLIRAIYGLTTNISSESNLFILGYICLLIFTSGLFIWLKDPYGENDNLLNKLVKLF